MGMPRHNTRRDVLKLAGVSGTLGLAGCLGSLQGSGGGPIPMGSILPVTGAGESFGGGEQEAVNLAAKHVNDAGGPLDRELNMINKDSESRVETATPKYKELANEEGAIGFVGEAFSGVSVALAKNVAQDEIMQMSPASTSPVLAEMAWKGEQGNSPKFFGRTAPNDVQQAIVMGEILNSDDYVGADTFAVLYRSDPYGEGLANAAKESFDGETVGMYGYSKDQSDFTSTFDKIASDNPDAVGLVTSPGPGSAIVNQAHQRGYDWQWVSSEGVDSPEFFKQTKAEAMSGMFISSASPQTTDAFQEYKDAGGSLDLFAPNAYDGLMMLALAVERAGEASGLAIAKNIRAVSNPEGTTVSFNEFGKAKDAIANGEEINYEGVSSNVNLNENYEPFTPFSIKRVENGEPNVVAEIPVDWFKGKI